MPPLGGTLVVGGGAIGCFLAARLGLAGHHVAVAGRLPLAEAVAARGGLVLRDPDGREQRVPGVHAAASIAQALAALPDANLAVLAVKAYDTSSAGAELLAAGWSGPVLTLQNGVGNEETLAQVFGADNVVAGAIDTPVSVPAPGDVQVHRTAYRIGLAPVGSAAPVALVAKLLDTSGFQVSRYASYRGLKWTKLLMNILANASCAVLDWSPAQVMATPITARLEARAWQEAMRVMARLAVHPVALGGYPFPLLAPVARTLPAGWLARGLRGFVSGGRGTKEPSLQIALRAGRPSEVAWLNGAVAAGGNRCGILTPVNGAYARVLADLVQNPTRRDVFRSRPERLAEQVDGPRT